MIGLTPACDLGAGHSGDANDLHPGDRTDFGHSPNFLPGYSHGVTSGVTGLVLFNPHLLSL